MFVIRFTIMSIGIKRFFRIAFSTIGVAPLIFLSLDELIDLTKSVVPDVKDPFKQRSESLAIFF